MKVSFPLDSHLDWKLGSKGIYDAASLENIQKAVQDMESFAEGNAKCCLSKPPPGTYQRVQTLAGGAAAGRAAGAPAAPINRP